MITRAVTVFIWAASFASASASCPFEPPTAVKHHDLFRRQGQCLSSQHFCPGSNGNSGCCDADMQCATDYAGRIACCPSGAVCTGQLDGSAGTATAASPLPTTQSIASSTQTTQAATFTGGDSSIVANPYFPYHYLPTTYPNADQCTSAFSSCRSEFSTCSSSLATGGNGVTISAVGGGFTAQPALGAASAGSICSSLSTRACYNLGLGNCPMYGTAAVTTGGGTFAAGNAAPTRRAEVYQIAIAIAVGVAGQAIR